MSTIVCLGVLSALNPDAVGIAQAQPDSSIEFLEDAGLPAQLWVRANPDKIAVSVRLGAETPVAPQRIEQALRADFADQGIRELRFFWERGGEGGSAVAYHTRNRVFGPFGLAASRKHVEETARQFRFELERGLN